MIMRIKIKDDWYIEIKGEVVLRAFDKNGAPVPGETSRPLSEREIQEIQSIIIADPETKDAIENLITKGEINKQQQ